MKKLYLLLVLGLTLHTLSSCKKCDPSNSNSGRIIEDAIVRVGSWKAQNPGNQFINSANEFSGTIEMSLDDGVSYQPVDFSKYSVFAQTTTSSCSSGYHREVSLNAAKNIATYSIEIVECSTCENLVTIGNWVLTSKVPSNFTAEFEIIKN